MRKQIILVITIILIISCSKEIKLEIPIISTDLSINEITSRTAILAGNIYKSSKDSIFSRGIVYGVNPNPTLADNYISEEQGFDSFYSVIKGLNPGITYYSRVFLTSKVGTFYGKQLTFDTPQFDFDWIDNKGKAIISKKSEYIVLIPDIQNYITGSTNNKYLEIMLNWIKNFDASGFHVKAILQMGDITNFNTKQEWMTAQKLFSNLDNKIDYIFCTGNHDYGDNGTTNNRTTHFNEYFSYANNKSYITSFEKQDFTNSCFNVSIHNKTFQIFSLEFGPRNKVLMWADSITKANPTKSNMLLTHAYLYKNNERYDYSKFKYSQIVSPYSFANSFPNFGKEKVNDGEEIWRKLIYSNHNFKFVFCGHITKPDYIGKLESKNQNNEDVLQMLIDTQDLPNGGNGWIQILEFFDDEKTVGIKTFTTLFNSWGTDSIQQYNFKYNNN